MRVRTAGFLLHGAHRDTSVKPANREQSSYFVGRCSQDRSVSQINNGVYRSGFATMQGAYERAQADLYSALDAVERRLSQHRFLVGDRCAEASPSFYAPA